jgi:hypothetical protein
MTVVCGTLHPAYRKEAFAVVSSLHEQSGSAGLIEGITWPAGLRSIDIEGGIEVEMNKWTPPPTLAHSRVHPATNARGIRWPAMCKKMDLSILPSVYRASDAWRQDAQLPLGCRLGRFDDTNEEEDRRMRERRQTRMRASRRSRRRSA